MPFHTVWMYSCYKRKKRCSGSIFSRSLLFPWLLLESPGPSVRKLANHERCPSSASLPVNHCFSFPSNLEMCFRLACQFARAWDEYGCSGRVQTCAPLRGTVSAGSTRSLSSFGTSCQTNCTTSQEGKELCLHLMEVCMMWCDAQNPDWLHHAGSALPHLASPHVSWHQALQALLPGQHSVMLEIAHTSKALY